MSSYAAEKDPDSVLDFTFDWSPYLAADQIDSVTWIVADGLSNEAQTNTNTLATIWLSGGTIGVCYQVVCRITTIGGRIDDRTIAITVKDK